MRRPDTNPCVLHRLTLPGAARGPTRGTTPEMGLGRPRPLYPAAFRPFWAFRRLGQLGGSQPAPAPASEPANGRGQIPGERIEPGEGGAESGKGRGHSTGRAEPGPRKGVGLGPVSLGLGSGSGPGRSGRRA